MRDVALTRMESDLARMAELVKRMQATADGVVTEHTRRKVVYVAGDRATDRKPKHKEI